MFELDTIILVLTVLVHFSCFWRIFEKAGRKKWEGLIPIYNLFIWLKLMRKPGWWVLLFLIPGVNFLMAIIMHVELVKMFGHRDLLNGVVAIFLPWVIIPYLAFSPKETWKGPVLWSNKKQKEPGKVLRGWRNFRNKALSTLGASSELIQHYDEIPISKEAKKTGGKEWGDAIVFAVIAATIIRGFFMEAFTIPTPSMERSLLVGDYLFVSKMSYGPRVPQTPIAFPFTHHTLPFTDHTPSYLEWYTLPYYRLPGFGDVERNDVVVFNFPAGDTVATKKQEVSYYQLVRQYGRRTVWNRSSAFGDIIFRPIDKRDNYIKRCVAIPGDTLEIIDDRIHINGKPGEQPDNAQWDHYVYVKNQFQSSYLLDKFGIPRKSIKSFDRRKKRYTMSLSLEAEEALKNSSNVIRVEDPQEMPKERRSTLIFPHEKDYDWSLKNFGPLWIPEKGETVELTPDNLPLYERIIEVYEKNDLEVKDDGTILINGKVADSYTFKMDYYWMMGDNRHSSADSRYWGFTPENHIVGEGSFIWFSKGEQEGIRWSRLFSGID